MREIHRKDKTTLTHRQPNKLNLIIDKSKIKNIGSIKLNFAHYTSNSAVCHGSASRPTIATPFIVNYNFSIIMDKNMKKIYLFFFGFRVV